MKATTDTFDVPDGDLTKQQVKALGLPVMSDRHPVTHRYMAKDGKVHAVRTHVWRLPKPGGKIVTEYVWTVGVEEWCPTQPAHGHWKTLSVVPLRGE